MRPFSTLAFATLIAMAALPVQAADSYKDLALFKSGEFGKGLWRMELLSSSDPRMMQAGKMAGGGMSMCMDAAEGLAKNQSMDEQQCTMKPLRNTREVAEVSMSCKDGSSVHSTLTRESAKSFLIDTDMKPASGKTTTMKARYSYEGECKNKDQVIQMDKKSDACKQMNGMDMSKMAGMCAKLPAEAKAQCEQQMKQMAGMCQ